MRKALTCLGPALVLCCAVACHAVPRKEEAPKEPVQATDPVREACDCCQKCRAAMKPVHPKPEEKKPPTDGCRDCCDRCGEPKKPAGESFPPEIPAPKR